MTKDPRRKGKLRNQKPTPIDDDLAQLATVIAEYQLDNNAYGWFRPPWRNGEWAMALAKAVAVDPMVYDGSVIDAVNTAISLIESLKRDGEAYELAGRLYNQLVQPKINTNTARLMAAALRCLQLKIANSHGGGMAYNEILIPAFLPLHADQVEKYVLEFRCNDAIGTSHRFKGDHIDRQRSAFIIAWKRGLYLAAYAVKPAY